MRTNKNEIDLALERYGYKFGKIFDTELEYFVHPLFKLLGIYSFDVIGFDRWLHKQGYREEEHGSMKDYVTLKYGEENEKFLEEVMNFRNCREEESE